MNDRELLELAAKAAWIDRLEYNSSKQCYEYPVAFRNFENYEEWNPLTDDGDALRLAVKLYLFDSVRLFEFRLQETRADPVRDDTEIMRRAIVRAAAEIGKGMK